MNKATRKTFVLVLTHEALQALIDGDFLGINLPTCDLRVTLDQELIDELQAQRLLRIPAHGTQH